MTSLVATHAALAGAALAVGIAVLLRRKGTASHKALGRTWVALMVWTLVSLTLAVWFIRRGNLRAHRGFMIGTFIGLAGAGLGALAPGRALYRLFFLA
jgi:uncharacterized membrane protein